MRTSLLILLFFLMAFPLSGWASPEDKAEAPLPLVKVATITLKNANPPEKYIGHIESIESIELKARVEGYLQKVNFKEGSFVQEDQLLYVIEQPPYQARVALAEAKVTQAEADLFKTSTRLRRLRSAQPESVPKTDLDDAKAAKDLAEGRLDEAKANLELARIDLDYTTIEAPITGRIGKSFYKKGDLVSPGAKPLAEIVHMDPIRVVFSVSENQGAIIQKAIKDAMSKADNPILSVKLRFPGGKAYPEEGRIDFVDNKVDPETATIAVWARFDNPKGRLVPGEYVKVFLGETQPDLQPAVPQVAVQRDKQGAFVLVVDDKDQVEKRRINTGPVIANKFIIKSGLSKGEKVIVQGIQKVTPGMKVKTATGEKRTAK